MPEMDLSRTFLEYLIVCRGEERALEKFFNSVLVACWKVRDLSFWIFCISAFNSAVVIFFLNFFNSKSTPIFFARSLFFSTYFSEGLSLPTKTTTSFGVIPCFFNFAVFLASPFSIFSAISLPLINFDISKNILQKYYTMIAVGAEDFCIIDFPIYSVFW